MNAIGVFFHILLSTYIFLYSICFEATTYILSHIEYCQSKPSAACDGSESLPEVVADSPQ